VRGVRSRGARRAPTGLSGAARAALAVVLAASVTTLSGCGLEIPTDPDGALDRITGGELRVGASPSGDLVVVDGTVVDGALADLIEGFAREHDATVEWSVDSEEDLVADLEEGSLDLAIGGITAATPWAERVSVTRGYPGIPDSGGADVAVLLPLGENGLQAALETYLDGEVSR
jgi:ABC-type amino acid transport substrate-binding protein